MSQINKKVKNGFNWRRNKDFKFELKSRRKRGSVKLHWDKLFQQRVVVK